MINQIGQIISTKLIVFNNAIGRIFNEIANYHFHHTHFYFHSHQFFFLSNYCLALILLHNYFYTHRHQYTFQALNV
jgi:hypothetical protein